jgi:hypothetical protein
MNVAMQLRITHGVTFDSRGIIEAAAAHLAGQLCDGHVDLLDEHGNRTGCWRGDPHTPSWSWVMVMVDDTEAACATAARVDQYLQSAHGQRVKVIRRQPGGRDIPTDLWREAREL